MDPKKQTVGKYTSSMDPKKQTVDKYTSSMDPKKQTVGKYTSSMDPMDYKTWSDINQRYFLGMAQVFTSIIIGKFSVYHPPGMPVTNQGLVQDSYN